jgi:hypothetical protein
MDLYLPYVLPLLAVCALSLTGTGPMIRTALAIGLNWLANTAFVVLTGVYDPWWYFIATDAVCCAVVLYQPAKKIQAVIGWTYMAQILMHVVYAVSNHAIAAWPYWQALTALAFLQLLLLGGWIGGSWYRRYRRPDSGHAHDYEPQGVAP